ncbi:XRN 5'-3' exonuclease [Cedratvirus kamchatka]|uniref:XRN 5'-3' exonuclease n=1 Tax=Cedratvirus kamchatka TaxID=2716914 RepID=A0A6G8MX73_9VIRU|nr:XRN 5'-3' exonuclease [Cedratvirus kamchatka]
MGVPKFYSWLRSKNRDFRGIIQRSVPATISSLSIDMNGLLHQVAQLVFSYGNSVDESRMQILETLSEEELYADYFATLSTEIMNLLTQVAPKDILILAVDGVAPLAKINQQRARRFTSSPTPFFNSNVISPGTDFMFRVDDFLRTWIENNVAILPPQIVYSSHMVPGEAEQKIFDFFREKTLPGSHCISGLDADLVVLSLTVSSNMLVIRQDITDIVSVRNLKEFLYSVMRQETAIPDFIYLSFLLGNDFLPNSPAMDDLPNALDSLLEAYSRVGKSLTDRLQVNLDVLREILSLLPEKDMVFAQVARSTNAPSGIISYRNVVTREGIKSVRDLNMSAYSTFWYEQALGPRALEDVATKILGRRPFPVTQERIQDMAQKYLAGMNWISLYYYGADLNLSWFYPYHYAPLLQDLIQAKPDGELDYFPSDANPFTSSFLNVPQQLTAIMPATSLSIIPEEMRELVFTNLVDEFPQEVIIEEKIGGAAWHKKVLLPFLDERRLVINTPPFTKQRIAQFQPDNELRIIREAEKVTISPPSFTGRGRGRGRGGFAPSRGRGGRGGFAPSRGRGGNYRGRGRGRGQQWVSKAPLM